MSRGGEAEGVSPFETLINNAITPNTYYSTRLDVYDIYGRCNEKKIAYTVMDNQGEVVGNGVLDDMARTPRFYRETEDKLKILVGHAQVLDWV